MSEQPPEFKCAGDLTALDVGRQASISRGDTKITGRITMVNPLGVTGWKVGGEELTDKAYVTIGIGLWTSTLHYSESVTFLGGAT